MNSLSIFALLIISSLGVGSCYTIKKNSTDEREQIVGGRVAEFVAPYHVFLKRDSEYICGGALVTYQHVLTAAHCLNKPGLRLSIIAGTNDFRYNGQEIPAIIAYPHPHFNPQTYFNDIAIIKLQYPFTSSPLISTISLPNRPITNNELMTITGSGKYHEFIQDTSSVMKTYTTIVVDATACSQYLKDTLTPSDLCDLVQAGNGVCMGDSGSPLVNQFNQIVGVASRVIACGQGYPNMYSSVYYNLNFVISTIQTL